MASSPALPRPGSPSSSAPWLEELDILIRARYPLLYLVSWEEHRLDTLLADMARAHGKALLTWSVTRGLRHQGNTRGPVLPEDTRNPLEAIAAIEKLNEPSLVVLKDFHPYLEEKSVVRALRELAHYLKSTFTTVILLSPTLTIPTELEKEVSVLDVPLPGFQELLNLLKEIVAVVRRSNKATIELSRENAAQLIQAAQGLTLTEAENAFAKAIAYDGRLDAADIRRVQDEKRQVIRKSGLLEFYPPEQDLGNVGGLRNLKQWLDRRTAAFGERARQFGLPEPRGLLMLGVQGCGKSLTSKAIAAHWNLPLLRLDMGRIFSGLVGSSEENLRKAIRVAESIAPVVLWVDEIEKGLSGVASSGTTDGGVTARVFGTLLTWLQEKTAPVFVVATANRIEGLPPELLRKGRFDEIFFIDLPEATERRDIFHIHLQRRKRDPTAYDLSALAELAVDFSGAEIEQVVIAALYEAFGEGVELEQRHLTRAIRETFPIAVTMRDEILRLREWARGRTRPASSSRSDAEKE
ncbi:AAA family ATPase [Vitiosangium sp. GDMCC 1.1324]|uniref:AAA family ATPase n=1 Tax=Vitiosangium sp. (strain GDMCC 1.1324) TaxID=2138576 RepID=UPI000D3881EA|nr:AAA family ATPase [Vitiosangium sp. GDMCC 1.1324]PTL84782.1 ATPase [Vitiosangium sp. GDMCC 1.1324]